MAETEAGIDLAAVMAAIDAANGNDPKRIVVAGAARPAAQVYGERMSDRLRSYEPAASPALQIAARGQHIERWTVPRGTYPEGRIGYLTWRKDLQRFHARRLGEIMTACGLAPQLADRVGQLVRKERLTTDPEAQTLEDVACLVFLAHEMDAFAAGRSDEQLATILAKTWRKMSARARATAESEAPPAHVRALLAAGLAR